MLIKLLAVEGDLSSASNVNNATVVRLFNNHSTNLVITQKTAGGATIGSFAADNGKIFYLEKSPTDTLESGSNGGSVKVVKIAYPVQ